MKIFITISTILFFSCYTSAQINKIANSNLIFNSKINKTLDSCRNHTTSAERLNSLLKQADISNNSFNKGISYLCAALYENNIDTVLNNIKKSIIWFDKFSPDSLIIFPDTLLNSICKKDLKGKADFYNQLGHNFYSKLPSYSIIYHLKAAKQNEIEKNYPWAGFSYLNISTAYAETFNEYEKAKIAIDSSINIWLKVKDTMQLANDYKYKGYILGYLHKFSSAKDTIKLAINIYDYYKFPSGKAVCFRNLAKVYEEENIFDSSFVLLNKAKIYWLTINDSIRLVGINNDLINLNIKTENWTQAYNIIDENEKLILMKNFPSQLLIEYYKVKIDIYKKSNQPAKLEKAEKDLEKFKQIINE